MSGHYTWLTKASRAASKFSEFQVQMYEYML